MLPRVNAAFDASGQQSGFLICCQYFVTIFDLWGEQVCDALMRIARTCSSDASRLNGCVLVWRHGMLLRDVCWCVKLHVWLCVKLHVWLCVKLHLWLCVKLHVWLCVKLHVHFDAQLQALHNCCVVQYSAHA